MRRQGRVVSRAVAGPLVQRRDGSRHAPRQRPVPDPETDRLPLQLPGRGLDVQAYRRDALWHRRAP